MESHIRQLRSRLRRIAGRYDCEIRLVAQPDWGTTWKVTHCVTGDSGTYKHEEGERDSHRLDRLCASLDHAALEGSSPGTSLTADQDTAVALALKEIVLDWSDMPEPFTTKILDAARWLSLDPTPAGLLHAKNLRAIIYEYIGPNEGVYETTEALREAADHIFARCNYAGFTEFRVRFDFDRATIVTGDYDIYNFELAFWAPEGDQFDPFLESMLSRFAADPA